MSHWAAVGTACLTEPRTLPPFLTSPLGPKRPHDLLIYLPRMVQAPGSILVYTCCHRCNQSSIQSFSRVSQGLDDKCRVPPQSHVKAVIYTHSNPSLSLGLPENTHLRGAQPITAQSWFSIHALQCSRNILENPDTPRQRHRPPALHSLCPLAVWNRWQTRTFWNAVSSPGELSVCYFREGGRNGVKKKIS